MVIFQAHLARAMRTLAATIACLAAALLSGCASSGEGTLGVHVTDAPDNIADFSSLTIEVGHIHLKRGDGDKANTTYSPKTSSFDLTKLHDGNVSTLFQDDVAAGNYSRLEIEVTKATGVLAAGGATVDVKAPKGSIFVNQAFTVGSGAEVHFLFDIHVVKKGNGDYSLQPNAGGSKLVGKPIEGKVTA